MDNEQEHDPEHQKATFEDHGLLLEDDVKYAAMPFMISISAFFKKMR
jgi:hypothetical protein